MGGPQARGCHNPNKSLSGLVCRGPGCAWWINPKENSQQLLGGWGGLKTRSSLVCVASRVRDWWCSAWEGSSADGDVKMSQSFFGGVF